MGCLLEIRRLHAGNIEGGSVKPTEHAAENETTGVIWLPPAGTTGLTQRRNLIQLFRERLSEKKMCTRQSRKVKWDMNNTLLFPINFVEIAVYRVQKRTDKHYLKNSP